MSSSSFHKKDGLPVKANTGGYLRSPLLISSSFVAAAEKFVDASSKSHSSRAGSSIWRHSRCANAEDEEEEGLDTARLTGGRQWTRAGVGAGSLMRKEQRAQQDAVEKVYGSFFFSSSALTKSNPEMSRNAEEEPQEKAGRAGGMHDRSPSSSSTASTSLDVTGRRTGMPRLFGMDTADRGAWHALQTKNSRARHGTHSFPSSEHGEVEKEEEEEYAKGGGEIGVVVGREGETKATLPRPPWKRPRHGKEEEEEEQSIVRREEKWRRTEGPPERTHDESACDTRKTPMDASSTSSSVVGHVASAEVCHGQHSSATPTLFLDEPQSGLDGVWSPPTTPTHTDNAHSGGGEESDPTVALHSHGSRHNTQATHVSSAPTTSISSTLNRMQRIQQMREEALFGKKKKKK